MKRTKIALSKWSEKIFGNIFQKIATFEDIVKTKEVEFKIPPTTEKKSSLSKVGADLKIYFHTKEDYWKQKVGMKWFSDEESNLKFFHAYVKGKRGKLQVKEI